MTDGKELDEQISDIESKRRKRHMVETGVDIVQPELVPITHMAEKAMSAEEDAKLKALQDQKKQVQKEEERIHKMATAGPTVGSGGSGLGELGSGVGTDWKKIAIILIILVVLGFVLYPFLPRILGTAEGVQESGRVQIFLHNTWEGFKRFITFQWYTEFQQEQVALASGDTYSDQVDEAATRQLGVEMAELETDIPESGIEEGERFMVFSEIDIETIDPLTLRLSCGIKDGVKGDIIQDDEFEVERSSQEVIDCEFTEIPAGTHTVQVNADYDFTTLSYLKSYFIDQDSLRALQSKDQDFFDTYDILEINEEGISSEGPVGIGMGIGKPPIAIGPSGRTFTLGITIHNRYDGQIVNMKDLIVMIPKGFEVQQRGREQIARISCADVPGVAQEGCDESRDDIYRIETEELTEPIKNIKNYRVYISAGNSEQVLGTGPYAVHNFKVTAHYDYQFQKERTIFIKEKTPFEIESIT